MPEEIIENTTKSGSIFSPTFVDHHVLPDINGYYLNILDINGNFNGYCLISNNISNPKKVTNMYISNIPNQWPRDLNTDFTLGNCLFGSVNLTKNVDLDKYKYSGYDIGFSLTDASVGKRSLFSGLI